MTSGTWRWKPVWTWAGGIVLAALLGGGGAHWWSENEHRETLARTMAQDVGQFYVIGAEATIYPELRSFCQKHQEEGLQALRVLDTRRELLNQYPRDFEPRATGLEVPIRTPDGILRGYLVAHHGPIPPGVQLFWFLIILAAGMAGLALWQYRDAEVARKDAELMRINALSTAFRSILSREGGEVANATQAIEGYRLQLQASLYDIVHDATKVEILGGSGAERLAERLRHLPELSDTQEGRLLVEALERFLEDVRRSTVTIRWILDGLPHFASHESEPVKLNEEFQLLLEHLPPRLRDPARCTIVVEPSSHDPVIRFNRVHLRSVLKNALYNATRAIEKRQEEELLADLDLTPGQVRIHVQFEKGCIGVCLEDNGTGLPPEALDGLYRQGQARTSSRGHGSDIVAAFLEFHGAGATVENRPAPERGARVNFWFARGDA